MRRTYKFSADDISGDALTALNILAQFFASAHAEYQDKGEVVRVAIAFGVQIEAIAVDNEDVMALAHYAKVFVALQRAELEPSALVSLDLAAPTYKSEWSAAVGVKGKGIVMPEFSDRQVLQLVNYAIERGQVLESALFLQNVQLTPLSTSIMHQLELIGPTEQGRNLFVYLSQQLVESLLHLQQLRDMLDNRAETPALFNAMLLRLTNQPAHFAALVARYVTTEHLLESELFRGAINVASLINGSEFTQLTLKVIESLADARIPLVQRADLFLYLSQQLSGSEEALAALAALRANEGVKEFLLLLNSDHEQRNRVVAALNQDGVAEAERNAAQQAHLMEICESLGGTALLFDGAFIHLYHYFETNKPKIEEAEAGSSALSGMWSAAAVRFGGDPVDNYESRLAHFDRLLAAVQGGQGFVLQRWKDGAPRGFVSGAYSAFVQAITQDIFVELQLMPNALLDATVQGVVGFRDAVQNVRASQAAEAERVAAGAGAGAGAGEPATSAPSIISGSTEV